MEFQIGDNLSIRDRERTGGSVYITALCNKASHHLHSDGVIRHTTKYKGEYLGYYRTEKDAQKVIDRYNESEVTLNDMIYKVSPTDVLSLKDSIHIFKCMMQGRDMVLSLSEKLRYAEACSIIAAHYVYGQNYEMLLMEKENGED